MKLDVQALKHSTITLVYFKINTFDLSDLKDENICWLFFKHFIHYFVISEQFLSSLKVIILKSKFVFYQNLKKISNWIFRSRVMELKFVYSIGNFKSKFIHPLLLIFLGLKNKSSNFESNFKNPYFLETQKFSTSHFFRIRKVQQCCISVIFAWLHWTLPWKKRIHFYQITDVIFYSR